MFTVRGKNLKHHEKKNKEDLIVNRTTYRISPCGRERQGYIVSYKNGGDLCRGGCKAVLEFLLRNIND